MKIKYFIANNRDEAFLKVKGAITKEYISQWKVTPTLSYNHQIGLMTAKGKGFKLTLKFHDYYLVAELELSFLLRALKSKVLNSIENELKKVV